MASKAQHTAPVKQERGGGYSASCTAEGCTFSVASAFHSETEAQAKFHEQKVRR